MCQGCTTYKSVFYVCTRLRPYLGGAEKDQFVCCSCREGRFLMQLTSWQQAFWRPSRRWTACWRTYPRERGRACKTLVIKTTSSVVLILNSSLCSSFFFFFASSPWLYLFVLPTKTIRVHLESHNQFGNIISYSALSTIHIDIKCFNFSKTLRAKRVKCVVACVRVCVLG